MKKYIFLFMLLAQISQSKDITLQSLLNEIEETSYQKEIYNIRDAKNRDFEKIYKLGGYNGVGTTGSYDYSSENDNYSTTGGLTYGDLYLKGEKSSGSDSNLIYGAQKSIRDLIFSSDKNELKKIGITDQIEYLSHRLDIQSQKITLINLYKEYLDSTNELRLNRNALKVLENDRKVQETGYKAGGSPRIDLESVQYSYENSKIEIQRLESYINKLKERFMLEFKIDVTDANFNPISAPDINVGEVIEKIGEKDIKVAELSKESTEQDLKYIKYLNTMPELSVGVERRESLGDNRVYVKFSKDLFYTDSKEISNTSSLKEQEIKLREKVNSVESDKIQTAEKLKILDNQYRIAMNKVQLERKIYEIKKLENKTGKTSYIDVMESFDKLLQQEIAFEKSKNSLYAYMYEILVRGEF